MQQKIFTEMDVDNMGWHDSKIHAISFGVDFSVLFDIDYIFEWRNKGKYFDFIIAPCTLRFANVYDLKIYVDSNDGLGHRI